MTNNDYDDICSIVAKLESVKTTLDIIRCCAAREENDTFYVALIAMESVLTELNDKLKEVYRNGAA